MGLKVTAAEAAQLVGRSERIVRQHIVERRDLAAVKSEGGRGRAWQIDVEDLGAIPGWHVDRTRLATLQERDARSVESLASRVAALEARVRVLEARQRAGEYAAVSQTIPAPETSESHPTAIPVQQGVTAGSVRLATFAGAHGVSVQTAQAQRRQGVISALSRPSPTRKDQEHWLTPEQQRAAVAEWERRGQLTKRCEHCPH